MKTLYFRVWLGYEKFISITHDELNKALAAHLSGGIALLANGSVSGKSITLIEPDYHRAMGYNEAYKLTPEDWNQIDHHCGEYKGFIGKVKEEIQQMLAEGKTVKSAEKIILPEKKKVTGHIEERPNGDRVYVIDNEIPNNTKLEKASTNKQVPLPIHQYKED
jgi:hypothetical protein